MFYIICIASCKYTIPQHVWHIIWLSISSQLLLGMAHYVMDHYLGTYVNCILILFTGKNNKVLTHWWIIINKHHQMKKTKQFYLLLFQLI